MKIFLGVLLILHGLVHSGLAAAPDPADTDSQPFSFFTTADRSWLFSRVNLDPSLIKWIGLILVGLATVGFVLAGIGVLTSGALHTIWRVCAAASSLISLLLLGFFWHPWLPVGILINLLTLTIILLKKIPNL